MIEEPPVVPWVWIGVALVVLATVRAWRSPSPGVRGALMVGWTWAWAEVLAAWLVPHAGRPTDHVIAERTIVDALLLPGDIGLPPPPATTRRIVVVGDSFTQGQGAPITASVPARLRDAFAPDGVEVRNHGMVASEFADQLTRYALLDREVAPDVLVWCFVLNDLEFGYDRHDAISVRWELTAAGPTPLTAAVRRGVAAMQAGGEIPQAYRESFDPAGERWQRFEPAFRRLVAATTARGARFVFVIWPLLHRLDAYPFAGIHEQLAALAADAGAEVVDLSHAFHGMEARALWAHPYDHHPNAEGYRLGAAAIEAAIRAAPVPRSRPWTCDAPALLDPPRDAWEQRFCADRSAQVLSDNAVALFEDHQRAMLNNGTGAMIGRVPPLLLGAAYARRAPDDDAGRAQDLARADRMIPR